MKERFFNHQHVRKTKSYEAHEDHKKLYEALEKSMTREFTLHSSLLPMILGCRGGGGVGGDGNEERKKVDHESPKTPHEVSTIINQPRPPPPAGPSVHSSDDEDIGNTHIPKVNLKQDWWKPLSKEDSPDTPEPAWSILSSDLPVSMNNWASALASTYAPPPENSLLTQTGDKEIFMDWFCKKQGITKLTQKDLEGPAFKIIKVFHPNVIHLQNQMEECHKLLTDQVDDAIIRHNVSKPLPLGGQPGQVTIQADFFFNKDLEYLRYGIKGGRHALSILKMKAAYYPDVGLEKMVPDQMWIEEECKYDIAAIVAPRHHSAVNLWIRNLVIKTEKERLDFQLGIESYRTQLNLTKPRWDATGFEFKHDFTIIDSSRAVTFRDKYEVQMIMRFNEIHKFSDGTLQQIDEALDYWVKEFKINQMNPG
ncbi:hypothetical protein Tco_0425545 [Tanacetum coccineum]